MNSTKQILLKHEGQGAQQQNNDTCTEIKSSTCSSPSTDAFIPPPKERVKQVNKKRKSTSSTDLNVPAKQLRVAVNKKSSIIASNSSEVFLQIGNCPDGINKCIECRCQISSSTTDGCRFKNVRKLRYARSNKFSTYFCLF